MEEAVWRQENPAAGRNLPAFRIQSRETAVGFTPNGADRGRKERFYSLTRVPTGFEDREVLTAWVNVQDQAHPSGEEVAGYCRRLLLQGGRERRVDLRRTLSVETAKTVPWVSKAISPRQRA